MPVSWTATAIAFSCVSNCFFPLTQNNGSVLNRKVSCKVRSIKEGDAISRNSEQRTAAASRRKQKLSAQLFTSSERIQRLVWPGPLFPPISLYLLARCCMRTCRIEVARQKVSLKREECRSLITATIQPAVSMSVSQYECCLFSSN